MAKRKKAYSYLRFSTPDQMKGDSSRRQTEAAQKYAETHDLDLDTELTFRDLGVSAFRAANVVEGALGKFMEAVDTGKVKRGSYLLVENLDRLSRDKIMAALNRFSAILEKGVKIVTLSDGKTYDAASLDNLPDLMLSLLVMSRAHDESKIKSQRLRAAWKNKKKQAAISGQVMTAKAPAWLRVREGSFEIIADRGVIVERIFSLTLNGWGKSAIARQLNVEGVAPFGTASGWHPSYIQKILRNPAVIGRYQPMRNTFDGGRKQRAADGEPIEDYFPAVVSESIFYRVKHSKPGPSGKGQTLPRNVLSGLVFCAQCDGKMHYVNKGQPPKGGSYLACDNARRKKSCDAKSVRFEPVLNYVLDHLPEYRNLYEVSKPNEQDRDHELDAASAQIAETEETIARLLDTLERVPSESAEKRLAQHETRLAAIKTQRTELEEKRVIRQTGSDSLDDYMNWYNRPIGWEEAGEVAYTAIAHMSAEIKRVVEKVVIEKDKPIRVVPRSVR